jgi:two-component system response regulator
MADFTLETPRWGFWPVDGRSSPFRGCIMLGAVITWRQRVKTHLILLIEDSPDDELFTRKALSRTYLQFTMLVAKDGREAVDILAAHVPDLVLLDLKMPKVGGFDVLRHIRAQEHLHQVPVIVLSSSNEPLDIKTCYDLGANSYVCKPVDYEAYRDVIGQIGDYWLGTNHRTPAESEG